MCTALSLKTHNRYFGRNLDIDRSYGEEVCIMPRNFLVNFRRMGDVCPHYAMIGMATVVYDVPLFYDAANEYGLCMAALNFPENAHYFPFCAGCDNVASFELIPWILCQCKTVKDARVLLSRINITGDTFSEDMPSMPLHWVIFDGEDSVAVESMRDGLHVYDDPIGVLTNNPPFEYHIQNLKKYDKLRNDNKNVVRQDGEGYVSYCQGLGAVGLPGDVSSMSRFVRAAFGKMNSACESDEDSSVSQVFHLLGSVEMVRGMCFTDTGTHDITCYSACINADRGLYYYTTYDNRRISCVDMHKVNLEGDRVSRFALLKKQSTEYQN